MRVLRTNKPIPVRYLKLGLDQGAYDVEKLIWLPGRTTPIRVPDLKAAGMKKRGDDATIAPPVKRQVPKLIDTMKRNPFTIKPKPVPNAPGLYVPPGYVAREKAKQAKPTSSPALQV